MARKKVRARDLKKQRWAIIVAALLAFFFIFSLFGYGFFGSILGGDRNTMPEQYSEPQPEEYLAYYQGEVNRLEEYIETHEAGEAVLLELVENYRYLSFIQQVFYDNQDLVREYDTRMVTLFKILADKDPENLQYRLELVNLYLEKDYERDLIDQEITFLQETLREIPNPLVHLSLVGILSSAGEEDLAGEEAQWLYEYLEERVAGGIADNQERFYYAVLHGEYLGNPDVAESILNAILEEEEEESRVYQEALSYLNYLNPDQE